MSLNQITPENGAGEESNWLEFVRRQVESLRYGVVKSWSTIRASPKLRKPSVCGWSRSVAKPFEADQETGG